MEAERQAIDEREIQRVMLDLTRTREAKLESIERKEGQGLDAFYERGCAWGLSVALNRIEELRNRGS